MTAVQQTFDVDSSGGLAWVDDPYAIARDVRQACRCQGYGDVRTRRTVARWLADYGHRPADLQEHTDG